MTILWVIMLVNFAMYFLLPILITKYESGYKYSNLLKLIGPIAAIFMNQIRESTN